MSNFFKIVAQYGYRENYAAHNWDGKGECPQGWKSKFGPSIVIADGIPLPFIYSMSDLEELLKDIIQLHEYSNDYGECWCQSLDVLPTDSLSWSEAMDAYFHEDYEYIKAHAGSDIHFSKQEIAEIYGTEKVDHFAEPEDPWERYYHIAEALGYA